MNGLSGGGALSWLMSTGWLRWTMNADDGTPGPQDDRSQPSRMCSLDGWTNPRMRSAFRSNFRSASCAER